MQNTSFDAKWDFFTSLLKSVCSPRREKMVQVQCWDGHTFIRSSSEISEILEGHSPPAKKNKMNSKHTANQGLAQKIRHAFVLLSPF